MLERAHFAACVSFLSRGVRLPSSASGSELSDCTAWNVAGGGAAAAQRPSSKAALAADHKSGTGRADDTTSQTLSVSRTSEGARLTSQAINSSCRSQAQDGLASSGSSSAATTASRKWWERYDPNEQSIHR